jgi:hypothetical protein
MSYFQKRLAAEPGSGSKFTPAPPKCLSGLPALWEFIGMRAWPEDGSPRVTGSVLVFGDEGAVKVLFNDRDSGYVAFATIDSEKPILGAIEGLLVGGRLDWRQNRDSRPKPRR